MVMGKRKAAPASDTTHVPGAEDGAQKAAKQAKTSTEASGFKNKEKVLLLSSRGITHRYNCSSYRLLLIQLAIPCQTTYTIHTPCRSRHLMMDLAQLLPHCKRDSKLDTKTDRGVINEVADMKVSESIRIVTNL